MAPKYRAAGGDPAHPTAAQLVAMGRAASVSQIAVEFRTSSFNVQSRRAIERLGATLDGVLRSHALHKNGTLRDTYVYSIVAAEWPAIRANLLARV
jgi:RimJ/RimL family protein N-acetyltransferase